MASLLKEQANEVRKILAKELHRPAIRHFTRRTIRSSGVDQIWSMDLVDMSKTKYANKHFTFILTVIDIFSRYAFAMPLKNKKGPTSTVLEAFKEIIDDSGRMPTKIWCDEGSEFLNLMMKQYLKENDITIYHTYSSNKASIIERFNFCFVKDKSTIFSFIIIRWSLGPPRRISQITYKSSFLLVFCFLCVISADFQVYLWLFIMLSAFGYLFIDFITAGMAASGFCDIIPGLTKSHLEVLSGWILERTGVPVVEPVLKYRASVNGWDDGHFWTHASMNPRILLVISTVSGCIFGGFANKGFLQSSGYTSDDAAFIFSLVNPHGLAPVLLPAVVGGSWHYLAGPDHETTFGGGGELVLYSCGNFATSDPSDYASRSAGYSDINGNSYTDPTGLGSTLFYGKRDFGQLAEIVAFQVGFFRVCKRVYYF